MVAAAFLMSACSQHRYFTIPDASGVPTVTVRAPRGWIQSPSETEADYIELIREVEPKIYPRPTIWVARSDIDYRFPARATPGLREQLAEDQYLSAMHSRGYTNLGLMADGEYGSASGRKFATYIEASNMLRFFTFAAEGDAIYTISLGADRSEIFRYQKTFHELLDTVRFHELPNKASRANGLYLPVSGREVHVIPRSAIIDDSKKK